MQYMPSDVKTNMEFGMSHGVRVMPKIDAPGHAGSWAEAYPDIVNCANMFWPPNASDFSGRLAAEPGTGQLNPLNPQTYQVIRNILHDVAALIPESFYHAGADEITPACWKSNPSIQAFITNGGTLSQLLSRFVNSTHPYIISLNRITVYWEDVLLNPTINVDPSILLNPTINVDPSILPRETTILQTWDNGPNNTKAIVAAGYCAIVSSSDYYYLDCGHGDFVGNDSNYDTGDDFGTNGESWYGPFKTWQRVYD